MQFHIRPSLCRFILWIFFGNFLIQCNCNNNIVPKAANNKIQQFTTEEGLPETPDSSPEIIESSDLDYNEDNQDLTGLNLNQQTRESEEKSNRKAIAPHEVVATEAEAPNASSTDRIFASTQTAEKQEEKAYNESLETILKETIRKINDGEQIGNIDAFIHDGLTALQAAIQLNNKEYVQVLLQAGANPNTKTKGGRTPLQMALVNNNQEIICDLLGMTAKTPIQVNLSDEQQQTPLHLAAQQGNLAIIQRLLKHHADKRLRNGAKKRPVDLAREKYNQLKKEGASQSEQLKNYKAIIKLLSSPLEQLIQKITPTGPRKNKNVTYEEKPEENKPPQKSPLKKLKKNLSTRNLRDLWKPKSPKSKKQKKQEENKNKGKQEIDTDDED